MNHLAGAASPYLLQHADNPVDWWPWGEAAFAQAAARDVPVFISIGYATCHWCHVMARESFVDPMVAAYLNENFVSIKVDREEHPDVDASYLTAAGAFTQNLGWPLSIFATPAGLTFFAGTYFPPRPANGMPEFLRVLGAVTDAWTQRRHEVDGQADAIGAALASASEAAGRSSPLLDARRLDHVVRALAAGEDVEFGGFGAAPKFPAAPVLDFLLASRGEGSELAARTLKGMGASPLRDSVEGGFFRYATRRDWTEPHYERMLYDNALLLGCYAEAWRQRPDARPWASLVADGIARFLSQVLQVADGGFASAQDSESIIDGRRSEGGYYARDEEGRRHLEPPALDRKLLTGWNGLAIAALARAGFILDRVDWLQTAARAADRLLSMHRTSDGRLIRSSLDGRPSSAPATLEDYGMFAGGLLELAVASGEARYATPARELVDACLVVGAGAGDDASFAVPGGPDAALAARGLALAGDPSEGAYPSGMTAISGAAERLYLLTGDQRYRAATEATLARVAAAAEAQPIGFGGALALMRRIEDPVVQLVSVTPAARTGDLVAVTRLRGASVTALVTDSQARAFVEAGFELFAGRTSRDGLPAAYLCSDFVCRLPVTDADALAHPSS